MGLALDHFMESGPGVSALRVICLECLAALLSKSVGKKTLT